MKIASSYHQQRLWFIDHFEKNDLYEESPTYHNISLFFRLQKSITVKTLQENLTALLERHTILRTKLIKEEKGIFQHILSTKDLNVSQLWHELKDLGNRVEEVRQKPIDFNSGNLLKGYFEKRKNSTDVVLIFHHAIVDRYSLKLIYREFLGLMATTGINSKKIPQYQDFSNWQNSLDAEALEPLLFFWKSKLKDIQILYFPTDNERKQVHVYEAQQEATSIDKKTILSFCGRENIQAKKLILAAYKMALARLTGLSDIAIGTFMDLRNYDSKSLVGPVENIVVLRSDLQVNNTLLYLVDEVARTWDEASEYKTMPFDRLVTELNPKKDMSRTALFDIFFAYESFWEEKKLNFVRQAKISNKGWGKYDFNLEIQENSTDFSFTMTYNGLYFNANTSKSLLALIKKILSETIENGSKTLLEIDLISDKEKEELVNLNETTLGNCKTTIVNRFVRQVKQNRNKACIYWSNGQSISYGDLDKSSNQLANFLKTEFNIRPEDRISVILKKSPNLVITILAILKAGAAYVPIDPDYPDARKAFIQDDSSCVLTIDDDFISKWSSLVKAQNTRHKNTSLLPENLAYIIYTSGTTGKPKGVMIEHRNVLSLLDSCNEVFNFSPSDTWSFIHSFCFDFSVWEIFGSLLTGGNLLIINEEEARDPGSLTQLMNLYKVTVFSQTPSAFYNFMALDAEIPSLRYVIFGGEALNPIKLKKWSEKHPQVDLVNMYGITETTVHVTFKKIDTAALSLPQSNIGRPLSFAKCYILDQAGHMLPFGRQGELYVSGLGVARGYLNRPKLDADRFKANSFDEFEKLYRTGDYARYLTNGEIEYIGRIDDQIKIRGYRIELDEIRKHLEDIDGVVQSAVILLEMPDGDKSIVAYASTSIIISRMDLKFRLAAKLPEYMVPEFVLILEEIPMNVNGKIDKASLPSPLDYSWDSSSKVSNPSNEIERKLFDIWVKLLNTDKFGVSHNFFELGGHSLKAMRLISSIHSTFQVRLELKQLFSNPTLEGQAKLIEHSTRAQYTEIAQSEMATDYPVSDAQRRLWVLSQFKDNSLAYNMPSQTELDSDIDIEIFKKAINSVIERHEILRTVFGVDNDLNIRQRIVPVKEFEFDVDHFDLRLGKNKNKKIQEYVLTDSYKLFDLENGPLLRAALFQVLDDKYIFYYNMHHIISDGWSMNVLIEEVLAFYSAYTNGVTPKLAALKIQYKDYALWQLEQVEQESIKAHQSFWLERLSGELPLLNLPSAKNRPSLKTYSGNRLDTNISSDLTGRLRAHCQENGGTLFIGLLTVWKILFFRYTSQNDIIIGTAVSGRDHSDLENQIGFYVNTLALRNEINPNENFESLYNNIKESSLEAFEHQIYPFDRLIEELGLKYDASRSAIFDVMIVLQNTKEKIEAIKLNGKSTDTIIDHGKTVSKFDLEITFQEKGDYLSLIIKYNVEVYEKEVIENMMKHYKQLMEKLLDCPRMRIGEINYINGPELNKLLNNFNSEDSVPVNEKSVISQFTEQVEKKPNDVALIFGEEKLTYNELDVLSNRLANCLIEFYSIGPEDLVCINLERSKWAVIAILGTLKSGGAYVPIDPAYPKDRIAYIKSKSNCKLIIDKNFLKSFISKKNYSARPPKIKIAPSSLAYVIYTSGSTGEPKGVMIEHLALSNYLGWAGNYYWQDLSCRKDFGLFTTLSFDLTATSLFLPLIGGGTLTVFSDKEKVATSIKTYFESAIPCIKLTPAHIGILNGMDLNPTPNIELAIVGGDVLKPTHVKTLRDLFPHIKIYNEYGPTESTVGCLVYEVDSEDQDILIGRPISNTKIYILNDYNVVQPIGVFGEICVNGAGLARGYLNRPELTAEKFIDNPFEDGGRIYKTGDLGCWLSNGNIAFLGRKDNQVKINGYRIELGEIEHRLKLKEDIVEVVVLVMERSSTKELIAYLVSEKEENISELRRYLSLSLPEYMLPSRYVQIESIPLTINGKIDRLQLLQIEDSVMSTGVTYCPPRTPREHILVSICEEVLKIRPIGTQDNFFNLGGDSIKSIQIGSRLKQRGYNLRVEDILRNPVLKNLAKLISRNTRTIDQSKVVGPVTLGPVQNYFFRNPRIVNRKHYNQSVVLKSKEEIDFSLLDKSIFTLLKHHDALRMVYKKDKDFWKQINLDISKKQYSIDFYDLKNEKNVVGKMTKLGQALQSNFNLAEGPLFRVGHFRLRDGDRLAIIVHHLIIDGISWRILLEDLSSICQQLKTTSNPQLPQKTDSFQYWTNQIQNYAASKELEKEHDYWNSICNQSVQKIPQDRIVSEKPIKFDTTATFTLDEPTTKLLLTKVHGVYNTEINHILLTGLSLAINEVFRLDQCTLMMEGHGREEIYKDFDVSRTVGWFTSFYPFILDFSQVGDNKDALIRIKENLNKVPKKGIGYGILKYMSKLTLKKLQPSITFNYLGDFGSKVGNSENPFFEYSFENIGKSIDLENSSDTLMDVSGSLQFDKLTISTKYSKSIHAKETIERFTRTFEKKLIGLILELTAIGSKHVTPSDLTFKKLTLEELATINRDNNLEDVYELSPLQKGIFYDWLSDSSPSLYLEQTSYRIGIENLDINSISKAYGYLVGRHGVLRTSFTNDYAGTSLQIVRKSVPNNFIYDIEPKQLEIDEQNTYLDGLKTADRNLGFDPKGVSQIRLTVFDLGNSKYEFVWSHHHIIMDGWCIGLLIKDFYAILNNIYADKKVHLPLPVPYSTYINWLTKIDKDRSVEFWKNYLSGYSKITKIPFLREKSKSNNTVIQKREILKIDGDVYNQFSKICVDAGVTKHTFVQAVWGYLLSKYNNTRDVVYGSVVSGRPMQLPWVEDMIGLFINTIPVRVRYTEDSTPIDLLKSIQEDSIKANSHHYLSLSDIKSINDFKTNIIDHIMVFDNYPIQDLIEGNISNTKKQKFEIESVEIFEQTNFDFSMVVVPSKSSISIKFQYNVNVCDSRYIKNMVGHFYNLFKYFCNKSSQQLSKCDYLTSTERDELLDTFNDTLVDYPNNLSIIDLFNQGVKTNPQKIAVVCENRELTYLELDQLSNSFGSYLIDCHGVRNNDLVGVKLDRNEWTIVAIFGILKIGGAYVPFNLAYPQEHIDYIEKDSNCKVYIDDNEIEAFKNHKEVYSKEKKVLRTRPDKLTYIMYTSGTTGKPKGVLINQKSIVRLVHKPNYISIDKDDRILSLSNFSFDGSTFDIFMPLLNGATLVISPKDIFLDLEKLDNLLEEQRISSFFLTTVLFNSIVETELRSLKNLKYVLFGGEQVSIKHVRRFKALYPDVNLHHVYGPTENTTFSTFYKVEQLPETARTVPIGSAISNSRCYILDESKNLIPKGVVGEIYLGGEGLSPGYLNLLKSTSEKFGKDPFMENRIVYKTGDIGKWSLDGDIEFIGRNDDQVKIRGFRIELGGIEEHLKSKKEIMEAVVVVTELEPGDKKLAAYFVSKFDQDSKELKRFLNKKLPDYMIPHYFIRLEKFPLNVNGKVDKNALPAPNQIRSYSEEEYVPPRTKKEKALEAIWRDLLKSDRISVYDNYYHLGGDSIKSIQLVSRLKQKGYSVKVGQILKTPVLKDLAFLLRPNVRLIDQSSIVGSICLTPIQCHFFEDKSIRVPNHFNQSVLLKTTKELDFKYLSCCTEKLIDHHDALRMTFRKNGKSWEQYNRDTSKRCYELAFYDLRDEIDGLKKMKIVCENLQSSLDLAKGALLKIAHFRLADGDRLLIIIHHLVIDGVSWRILLEDLANLYNQCELGQRLELPLKTDSYQHWASSLNRYSQGPEIMEEKLYWESVCRSTASQMAFEKVYKGRNEQTMANISFVLGKAATKLLQTKVHDVYNTRIDDLLLTALALALKDSLGTHSNMIKMEGHGREDIIKDIDISRTVGWFTTIFPFILDISDLDDAKDCLVKIKEDLRKVPNKGIGYGILKNISESLEYDIHPSIVFNYLGEFGLGLGNEYERLFEHCLDDKGSDSHKNNKNELLNISGIIVSDTLSVSIQYPNTVYKESKIARLAKAYEDYLTLLIAELSIENRNVLTPSDLTFKGLTLEEFASINSDNSVEDVYEVSPLQQGFYFHWSSNPSASLNVEQISYRLKAKDMNLEVLKLTYDHLISRHAVLRTSFTNRYGGALLQIVKTSVPSNFSSLEFNGLENLKSSDNLEQINSYVDQVRAKDRKQGFDLEEPSQMRLQVLNLGKSTYEFIWSFHHILMDGWCIGLLINDFFKILRSLQGKGPLGYPKPKLYSKYIQWLRGVNKEVSLKFWEDYLEGYHSKTCIPFKTNLPKAKNQPVLEQTFDISGDRFSRLRDFCIQNEITQNTFIHSVWGVLLSKYNNTEDVVFGNVVSGRPGNLDGVEGMIGLFINTIPIRIKYHENDTPTKLIKQIQQDAISGTDHHYVNLSEIQYRSEVGLELIDHIMVFENYPVAQLLQKDRDNRVGKDNLELIMESVNIAEETNYDFSILVLPSNSSMSISFRFKEHKYAKESIKNIADHFSNLIEQFCLHADKPLKEFSLLTKVEVNRYLNDLNDTKLAFLKGTLVDLFERQVRATHSSTAIVFNDRRLTYGKLDALSNQFAHYLIKNYDIKPNDLIMLMIERSEWMIISILAILKAGAAYLPIDLNNPNERINYIKKDSQCKACIDSKELDLFLSESSKYPRNEVGRKILVNHLAYVIYTSGTSGKPKGVMVEHKGITNTIQSQIIDFDLKKCRSSLQFSSLSFDASISEIFISLLSGTTLYIVDEEHRRNPRLLEKYIAANRIDIATLPPSLLNLINIEFLKQMKILVTAGEPPILAKVKEFLKYGDFINAYGPTETSICASVYKTKKDSILKSEIVPIGKPIANVKLFVLDKFNNLQPEGIEGEIYIGGAGLARSYLNRDSFTKEKFVPSPFAEGELLYKTGDLGKWSVDGNLMFLGRADDQVKISGHRVELQEIEQCLLDNEEIDEAIVLVKTAPSGENNLGGYIVSKRKQNTALLRKFLSKRLPEYMLPSYYVELERIPLKTSGKVDRKALLSLDQTNLSSGVEFMPPQNKIEEKLIEILANALGREKKEIGILDNFFDLGVNSIKLIKILGAINKELGINLKILELFQYSNVNDLVKNLEKQSVQNIDSAENLHLAEEIEDMMDIMEE